MTDTAAPLHDAQFQYVTGQGRPGFATLLPDFEARSAAVASAGVLDIRYGEAARETFDFFPATGTARGLLVYFHAGYWQSRDKSLFRFIAPAFTARGLQVALSTTRCARMCDWSTCSTRHAGAWRRCVSMRQRTGQPTCRCWWRAIPPAAISLSSWPCWSPPHPWLACWP